MKTLLFLLLPLFTFAQSFYNATTINKRTKEKVPFATVGIVRENRGTNADENGQFTLAAAFETDTLVISCVGYKTLLLPFNTSLPKVIELEEKQAILAGVTVSSKLKWNYARLNSPADCGAISITTRGFQTQIAKLFTAPADNAMLSEIEVCKSNQLFETHKTIFRLRFYDMDTLTKAPAASLYDAVIEVKTSTKTTRINLERYKILLPHRTFLVAVEWLKIPYNEDRSKATIDGRKQEYITYRPNIGCNNGYNKNNRMEPGTLYEVWGLSYQNKWFRMPWVKDLSISAIIKY